MEKYFISYNYINKNNETGFGNTIIEINEEINSVNFKKIEEKIRQINDFKKVLLNNFIKLREIISEQQK